MLSVVGAVAGIADLGGRVKVLICGEKQNSGRERERSEEWRKADEKNCRRGAAKGRGAEW